MVGGFSFLSAKEIVPSPKFVKIGTKVFIVEVARTKAEQEKGLMYRSGLGAGKGMLFVFETVGIHLFWMKDTLIPLDIIWVSQDERIIYIQSMAQPHDKTILDPKVPAKYVLEINGGLAERYHFKVGDKVLLSSNI
jgi:uncharacterized membrane protein (UPF0127 family)